jgi:hypothetical protein
VNTLQELIARECAIEREQSMTEQQKQPEEVIHLKTGLTIKKERVGFRSTNYDKTEEYGWINHQGRTLQVKQIGPHEWEEREVK